MQVIFTKINHYKSSSIATRDDQVCLFVPGFGSSRPIPHDMVHFITEQELKVDHGFWGCVAAGAVYLGMHVVSGQPRHDAKKRSQEIIKTGAQKMPEAEYLAAVIHLTMRDKIEDNWPKIQEHVNSMWHPSRPGRAPMTHEEIKRICDRIHQLARQWEALPDGGTMVLDWNPKPSRIENRKIRSTAGTRRRNL